MGTLRQRNRLAAMERIAQAAFALFEERGYARVKVADIAHAAEVSESTFYRIFQTKEGLFTAAPWDGTLPLHSTDPAGLVAELRTLFRGGTWAGMRWVIEEPEVRRAVLSSLDGIAAAIADHLGTHGTDPLEAAVFARSLVFGAYFSALEKWHRDGRTAPFETYFDRAALGVPQQGLEP